MTDGFAIQSAFLVVNPRGLVCRLRGELIRGVLRVESEQIHGNLDDEFVKEIGKSERMDRGMDGYMCE